MLVAPFLLILSPAVPPTTQTTVPNFVPRMKAVVHDRFGSPDVLRVEEIDRPVPSEEQVLIQVHAASINPLDWHYMEGLPYLARPPGFGLLRPTDTRLGVDFAGTIVAVGKNVSRFRPGDEVFGGKQGALAEYVCVREEGALAKKPDGVSFEEAASVPIAGITALQALRDQAHLGPGQTILINGASGGVGTFAVQIAKSFGAEVTGVCSTGNLDLVRSLGADHVIDYTKEDFVRSGRRYDVILDNVGNRSLLDCRRALQPEGRYLLIGGGGAFEDRWLGPLPRMFRMLALAPFVRQDMRFFMADMNREGLAVLSDLMKAGQLKPVIDRRYALSEITQAFRYLELGHARGKVVILLDKPVDASPPADALAAYPEARTGAVPIALALLAGAFGATVLPILVALALDRRYRRRHPGTRPFRWGYYFGIQSFVVAWLVAALLGFDLGIAIAIGLVYLSLGWAFARRRRWAWILLTILSFNPAAWIINAVYLRKRWTEEPSGASAG